MERGAELSITRKIQLNILNFYLKDFIMRGAVP